MEEQISIHELMLILQAQAKKEFDNLCNMGMLQGHDIRGQIQNNKVKDIKKKAAEKLWKESNGMYGEDFYNELGIEVVEE